MNHRNLLDAGALSLAVPLLAFTLAACSGSDKQAGDARPAAAGASGADRDEGLRLSADEAQRAGIRLETLSLQPQASVVTVTATIKANQDRYARVAPRIEGRIVAAPARLGDHVTEGQPLATLDSVALGEAEAALREAQSSHRIAQAEYQRAEGLVAQEIIPQRDWLRAKGDYEKSSSELDAARDKLRLLGAGAGAGDSGGRATFQLRSPLAGTVIQKEATVGELATPASPVFTVADLSRLWIEANLTEDMLARVHPGAAATVTVAAYPGERFAGKVTYIAGVLNKDTHATPARIEVDNRDGRLKPEMFATALVDSGQAGPAGLSVPDGAVILLQGQPTVFVLQHGGYAPKPVETGDKLGGRTLVKSGLKVGDQVVASGTYALKARLLKSQISEE